MGIGFLLKKWIKRNKVIKISNLKYKGLNRKHEDIILWDGIKEKPEMLEAYSNFRDGE